MAMLRKAGWWAVGVVMGCAGIFISPMIYTVGTNGDPLSVWTTAALEGLLFVLPPVIGGWWAGREREARLSS